MRAQNARPSLKLYGGEEKEREREGGREKEGEERAEKGEERREKRGKEEKRRREISDYHFPIYSLFPQAVSSDGCHPNKASLYQTQARLATYTVCHCSTALFGHPFPCNSNTVRQE